MKTFEEMREEHPNIEAFVSIKTEGVNKAALANMAFCEKIGQAVMKNKKFRAVLEYDPEELNSTFFIEFDEPGSLLKIYPTKEAAEQASRERIKCLGAGSVFFTSQKRVAEEFCGKILEKIKKKANLAELNEMIRTLPHFEATGTLPDAELVNTVANRYLDFVEDYISRCGFLTGDITYVITDSIRCIHRLNDIMWKMRQEGSRNATD